MKVAKGRELDILASYLGVAPRRYKYKRAWWLLWLGWRKESDNEFRTRLHKYYSSIV